MLTDFLHRHRAGVLMLFFSTLSLLVMALHVSPYVEGFKTSLWFLLSPQVVYSGEFFNKIDSLRGRFFHLVRVEGENVILREQNAQLSKEQSERDELERENNRLRSLLQLKEKLFTNSIAAEVVAHDVREWFHAFVINKGRQEGVPLSAAVITINKEQPSLLGRVSELDEHSAKVLLLTDAVSAISVVITRTNEMGLLEGRNKPWVTLNYLPETSDVMPGDEVRTAGLGGLFPAGIPVGKVESVKMTDDGFFKQAKVYLDGDANSAQNVLILQRLVK